MHSSRLNAEQLAILEFLAPGYGEGLTLAHDIAANCGFAPRAAGAKLRALEARGLVQRRMARRAKTPTQNHLYGWIITDEGYEVAAR